MRGAGHRSGHLNDRLSVLTCRSGADDAKVAVGEHHPYTLCVPCLAAEHGVPEFEVRESAQVAVLREGAESLAGCRGGRGQIARDG